MSQNTALAIRDDQVTFDDLQRKALAHMGVDSATPADLAVFFHVVRKTGLDPFARQIHMIGRNSKNQRTQQWETKYTIQTGIDGYRLIARRAAGTNGYGYEETLWCGPDGQWTDVWVSDQSPTAAKVVVVRDGRRFPAVARYKAYVQTKRDGSPNTIWAQRDAEQLEKCAEALALRKAFPQDLSGIYTEEELRASGDTDHGTPAPAEPSATITAADFTAPEPPPPFADSEPVDAEVEDEPAPEPSEAATRAMFAAFRDAGFTDDARSAEGRTRRLEYVSRVVDRQVESSKELNAAEVSQVIDALKADADQQDELFQQEGA